MKYEIEGKIWKWPGDAAWHFITIPTEMTNELKSTIDTTKRGFSSLKVEVKIKDVSWKTSIFYDSKSKAFLLPVKKEIRSKTALSEQSVCSFILRIVQV